MLSELKYVSKRIKRRQSISIRSKTDCCFLLHESTFTFPGNPKEFTISQLCDKQITIHSSELKGLAAELPSRNAAYNPIAILAWKDKKIWEGNTPQNAGSSNYLPQLH